MRMSRFALLATAPLALAAIVATAPHASAGDISEALTSNGPSLNGIPQLPHPQRHRGQGFAGNNTVALNGIGITNVPAFAAAGTSLADLSGVRVEAVVLPGAAR